MPRFSSFRATSTVMGLLLPFVWASSQAAQPTPGAPAIASAQSSHASAPWVEVQDPWIRPTVKGQTVTGGFMVLTARQALKLEGFSMALPGVPELHEMSMDNNVMRMRAVASLDLPKGKAVALRPGGHHLMLTQLQSALKAGDELAITLNLRTADGQAVKQTIKLPVKMSPQEPSGHQPHSHQGYGMAH